MAASKGTLKRHGESSGARRGGTVEYRCWCQDQGEMQQSENSRIQALRWPWDHGLRAVAAQLREFSGRHGSRLCESTPYVREM